MKYRIQHHVKENLYEAQVRQLFWWKSLNGNGWAVEGRSICSTIEDAHNRIQRHMKNQESKGPAVRTVWQSWNDHGDYPGP